MCGIVFRYQEHAAGVAIKAVNDAGAELAGGAREGAEAMQQRVNQGSRMHACARVNDHTGGLIDGHDVGIFVQDGEREWLGNGTKRSGLGGLDFNEVGGADYG